MTFLKFSLPVVLFVLTIAAGFWVARTGKPYNTGVFTLHKLLALAAVVCAVIMLAKLLKAVPSQSLVVVLVVIAAISVIALFATGALMSIQKTVGNAWLLIHCTAPIVLAGSAVSVFFLLFKAV